MRVTTRADGLLKLSESLVVDGQSVTVESFGFTRHDSRLIVLVDTITVAGGPAGLGIMVALEVL